MYLTTSAKSLLVFFVFTLFVFFWPKSSFGQGNEIATAAPLNSALSCTLPTSGNPSYTLNNATASSGVPAGCVTGGNNSHYDAWFSFSASNTTETVTIGNFGNKITNPEVQIFSGTAYANFVSLACGTNTATATSLTINTTYYVRVANVGADPSGSGQSPKFDICLTHPPPPPSNDDCSGASLLTSATACSSTSGTVAYATTSTGITAGCESVGSHYDVWYKFVASATNQSVSLSGAGTNFTSPALQLYGGTCGSLNSIVCGTTTVTSSSFVVGDTYYVKVSNIGSSLTSNGEFSICVTHPTPPPAPPSNDDCSGATTLSVGNASLGTVWGATTSSVPIGCASGTPDDDVWYKFTATSSSVNISLSSLGSNLNSAGAMLQLFSGTCGSLTSLACGYGGLGASVTSGNQYFIRVYSSASGSIGGVASGSAFNVTVNNASTPSSTTLTGSRMNEVFKLTTISTANNLNYPWEVTYGPDGYLWITESRGYKVVRMDPATGIKNTVLDISQNSNFLPAADQSFNLQFSFSGQGNPQGGCAGLVLHPLFLDPVTPKNYVYLSYIHTYNYTAASSGGVFFTNRVVRFNYNTTTGFLENPVSLCDTLPGSSDHNSQRMIIAPVGGTYYLFYASGDMGAGQYTNLSRPIKSQNPDSYEGKILRFNLESDGDGNEWIPNDNPFGSASAVWSTGIRNNQGFAYAKINGTDYLFGSSHGPFSDDEVNIIEKGKNYGHPLVIGFSGDANYDGARAGPSNGSLPAITSESANATAIGADYKDPIFSFYPVPKGTTTTSGTIQYIYSQVNSGNGANGGWPSEAPSGLDIYSKTIIPGWKNSLVSSALKWGRLVRLKLNSTGSSVQPISGDDTAAYFDNPNRYRDLAFSPDGKDIFVVMDNNSATSGPGTNNPSIVGCAGCVHKYTFLGYNHNGSTGRSNIPASIDVTTGDANTIMAGTTITIDATNSNLWVPITGPDGNILAEIKANGNNLGTVISKFYTHSGPAREDAAKRVYLNRSITITPQNQPTSTVNVRLYITSAELTSLIGATNSQGNNSGVSSIGDIKILKNDDASPEALIASTSIINPAYAEVHSGTTNGGYVLQADITSFSSFYFGDPDMIPLPLQLVSFNGKMKDDNVAALQWETANESNTSHFEVERSTDAQVFEKIGSVSASGNSINSKYPYTDNEAGMLGATVLYYRLKMVDKDGKASYSQVISLSVSSTNIPVVIYPNPVSDVLNLKITLPASNHVHLQVTDMQGRVVYKESRAVRAGMNEININTKAWPGQSYSIRVTDSKKKILVSKKIVKM